jgi:hypothetical protein
LISENEFKITGMFFAPIPISNVKSFKTHLWPRARVSRHTYGQGFHDTPMAKGFKTHLWPRVSRHTYGQEFQDTPMAKGFKTHLWPRVSRHTYGQGFQDTPMAKGFKTHLWPRVSSGYFDIQCIHKLSVFSSPIKPGSGDTDKNLLKGVIITN